MKETNLFPKLFLAFSITKKKKIEVMNKWIKINYNEIHSIQNEMK